MADKFLDYSGVELLWRKIKQLTDKKLEKVEAGNASVTVKDNNKVAVQISKSEDNLLSLKQDGLHSARPVLNKLTFGADKAYTYDGTEDVTVPVYQGETNGTEIDIPFVVCAVMRYVCINDPGRG